MVTNRHEVLDFWFGTGPSQHVPVQQKIWFAKREDIDNRIRERFLDTYEAARSGRLEHWRGLPEGALAMILVLDQFSRNIFRETPKAFATDELARSIAHDALERGWDQELTPLHRWFVYMPFEHSESLSDQSLSVQLFETLALDRAFARALDFARRHRDVIVRFGRFPHRNVILGRVSTPEEEAFLRSPGSVF